MYMDNLSFNESISLLIFQMIWIIVLALFLLIIWKLGSRRYEAQGG